MKQESNQTTLKLIALLLFGNLCTDLYEILISPAHASSSVDCKIVDISSSIYNSLPIKIERIGNLSSQAIPVKVADWDTYDEVKVQVTDWNTSDTVNVRQQ